ncbi:MAG: C1 family peptidase [Bacteroidaceae bacterium]|nr:C1 family peptidase [Bacteroidaceae bacterium]
MAALLTASALSVQAADTFKARVRTTAQQTMNISLSASDTIPLSNLGTIYALSIDAVITQPREASFVRIVLEDVEGHNYLVAESDRFRNDTTSVNLSEYCEETAQLNGITPLRLKCYLTHASLQLTGIHISNEMSTRGVATEQELRAMKEAQVQDIVDRINEYNVRHHKLWRADITTASMLPLQQRYEAQEMTDETNAYFANLLYYTNGFYEIGEPSFSPRYDTSLYIDSFDWRNRHGQDWTTIPKNQWSSNWCAEFATVGTIESYVNLYYNRHLNLDLSETYLAFKNNQGFRQGETISRIFTLAKRYGVIDESSFPFVDDTIQAWPQSEPTCSERITITNWGSALCIGESEYYKRTLIKRGPYAIGFGIHKHAMTETGEDTIIYKGHAVSCVGYGKVTPDKMYFYLTDSNWTDTLISGNDPRIGMDYWIYKDSYYNHPDSSIRKRYTGHEGYIYLIYHERNEDKFIYFPKGSLQSLNYNDSIILCEDLDGDGYFNWGIGPKPSHCPSWAAAQPDGDDSDDTKGPMDQYGFCSSLSLGDGVLQITNPLTIESDYYMRNSIRVSGNGKLIIPHELHCYRGVTLTLESGTTLEIDGGLLKNIILDAKPGSSVIIKNGGRLLGNKQHGEINIPVGVNLDISEGEMRIND